MFRDLDLRPVYDSSDCDLVRDLIVPLLKSCTDYRRGVGFFSSGWLSLASEGIVALVERGGMAKIVLSPILDESDWEAIRTGNQASTDDRLRAVIRRNIADLSISLKAETRNCLAWLVADRVLEFRFAVARPGYSGGDYHDKVWVFSDEHGDCVSLHGSFNDSVKGSLNNEAISVFKSWEPGQRPYVEQHRTRLQSLWDGNNKQMYVAAITEAEKGMLVSLRTSIDRPYDWPAPVTPVRSDSSTPKIPVELRPSQLEAIDQWFSNGCRGILEMATGTGKTFTALACAVRCFERSERVAIVILVPYLHLMEQWENHCVAFGFRPVL